MQLPQIPVPPPAPSPEPEVKTRSLWEMHLDEVLLYVGVGAGITGLIIFLASCAMLLFTAPYVTTLLMIYLICLFFATSSGSLIRYSSELRTERHEKEQQRLREERQHEIDRIRAERGDVIYVEEIRATAASLESVREHLREVERLELVGGQQLQQARERLAAELLQLSWKIEADYHDQVNLPEAVSTTIQALDKANSLWAQAEFAEKKAHDTGLAKSLRSQQTELARHIIPLVGQLAKPRKR